MWRIDSSEAPKDHPDLVGTIREIQAKLADPNFVRSICVHEAAHAFYWSLLERTTTPDYTIRIRLNSSKSACIIEYAAMVLVNRTEQKEWTDLGLAKAHAAGSTAAEILVPGYERGDSEDFENFQRDILAVTSANLDDLKAVWQQAREEIKGDIKARNSPVRTEIEQRSIAFERNFRLVSEIG